MNRLLLCAPILALCVTASAQSYQGSLDVASCGSITGWAWDSTQPNTHINVDLYDGTTLIETVAANIYNAGLYGAGIGNGEHEYVFTTPASLKNGQNHTIHGMIAGTSDGTLLIVDDGGAREVTSGLPFVTSVELGA